MPPRQNSDLHVLSNRYYSRPLQAQTDPTETFADSQMSCVQGDVQSLPEGLDFPLRCLLRSLETGI
jgi:hypothetical protein